MGYFPYTQMCIHGHKWGAAFTSFDMRDTGRSECPECGCTRIGRVEGFSFARALTWGDEEEPKFEGICKHTKTETPPL